MLVDRGIGKGCRNLFDVIVVLCPTGVLLAIPVVYPKQSPVLMLPVSEVSVPTRVSHAFRMSHCHGSQEALKATLGYCSTFVLNVDNHSLLHPLPVSSLSHVNSL